MLHNRTEHGNPTKPTFADYAALIFLFAHIVAELLFCPLVRKVEIGVLRRQRCDDRLGLAQNNMERDSIAVITESIYQVLCGVFILLMQFGVMERARLSHSVDTMRELIHEQHNQFRQSKESLEIVNEKYHDLKSLLEGYNGQVSKEQLERLQSV